jgi:3-methyladenine DNA glycosylase AlkD
MIVEFPSGRLPPMNAAEVLAKLKKLGKPSTVEIYKRHGATGDMYGVSFADLGALTKQIKVDHALAQGLWKSGNLDARTLALMIADPSKLTPVEAETWLRECSAPVLLGYLAKLVARSGFAREKMEAWTKSKEEYPRTLGYTLRGALLAAGADADGQLSDDDCRRHLAEIEKNIHTSPNRAKEAMNHALIAIGIYRPALEKEAIAAARRIGKVDVDHGETGCKTPDAEAYILKAKARAKAKKTATARKRV